MADRFADRNDGVDELHGRKRLEQQTVWNGVDEVLNPDGKDAPRHEDDSIGVLDECAARELEVKLHAVHVGHDEITKDRVELFAMKNSLEAVLAVVAVTTS
jgi:hypothetical protein